MTNLALNNYETLCRKIRYFREAAIDIKSTFQTQVHVLYIPLAVHLVGKLS